MKILSKLHLTALLILVICIGVLAYSKRINLVKFNLPENKFKKIDIRSSIDNLVKEEFSDSKGTYAIVIKNLATDEVYSINEHITFETASLYKLWVMAVAYQQIENGLLTEDQWLSADASLLNKAFYIPAEYAEITHGKISMTVENAIKRMITYSDNYAAYLLSYYVRMDNVQKFLNKNEFLESHIGTDTELPKTTAHDIALFYEKLHNGKLSNKENTEKMIELLKAQQINTKIPLLLPENTVIAHKTGELDNLSHDTGIAYLPNNKYILVVLTESNNVLETNSKIARLSKAVFDYYK